LLEQYFNVGYAERTVYRQLPKLIEHQEAIKAHVLVCFMALMVGKYLEIKTEQSLRQVRDQLWKVHEAHLRDDRTGKVHILRTNTADWANTALGKLLDLEFTH
jgi:hypothetical protein